VEQGGAVEQSRAAFFGLRLQSDRVLFVVDLSGSMATSFGTGGQSRYEEAKDQLFRFLEAAGERTRFGVVLFEDRGTSWRRGLRQATPANLERLQRWLAARRPGGATELFEGLREGLALDREGRLDPARVEADTVVVLCDGQTADGPRWVRPWLARENQDALLRFHGVQIGHQGDGTLEALAEASGGDFVRVTR
jgi:Mg-chelatase subunit ChlD